MGDGIYYGGRLVGSIHRDMYGSGRMVGGGDDDFYVRFENLSTLEKVLALESNRIIRIDDKEMHYKRFREEFLEKARDIHLKKNSNGTK